MINFKDELEERLEYVLYTPEVVQCLHEILKEMKEIKMLLKERKEERRKNLVK